MITLTRRLCLAISLAAAVCLFLTTGFFYNEDNEYVRKLTSNPIKPQTPLSAVGAGYEKFHLLLPATNEEVNLCKTLLTAAILDYPTPSLIGWNVTYDNTGGLLGWGSHVGKITGVLEYLESLDSSKDNELVLMMDAYDIWFQLRPEVLVSRYHSINDAANERLRKRLGRAVDKEGLAQTIIFGAGKRCAPNQVHTVACYPIPESPLPDDLYGLNTDTIMGRNKYTSLRQRYLNSGYVIGPVGDMRKLWRRAQEKLKASEENPEWDNGSHGADFMYHGSDQSVFNIILGEQEFQREVMRRRHRTTADKAQGIAPDPPPTKIEGTIIDDPINPSWTHEPFEAKEGKPDEFGIGLDYFSELGQQTVNSEEDARYLQYDGDLNFQVSRDPNGHFDCPRKVSGNLPADVELSRPPFEGYAQSQMDEQRSWKGVPLYTNMCLDTIPIMIHHNGNKDARGFSWPWTWMQPNARKMMGQLLAVKDPVIEGPRAGGAYDKGEFRKWSELCPSKMDPEIYRDAPS